MFTGLVQSIGVIERSPQGVRLRWTAPPPGAAEADWLPVDLALGDSVAVDGVCLTVAERLGDGFRADVSPETLGRTTLLAKAEGRGWVNLEPALRLADRLGGHLVSGHVDGLAEVVEVLREGEWRVRVRLPESLSRFAVERGSITLDGVSLTIARVEVAAVASTAMGDIIDVCLIPETLARTTLAAREVGDVINLEVDYLAKLVARQLEWMQSRVATRD